MFKLERLKIIKYSIIIYIFVIGLLYNADAQININEEDSIKRFFIIKISPFGKYLWDLTNSWGVKFGIEHKISSKMSIEQNLSYIFLTSGEKGGWITTHVEDIKGILSGTEVKYFISKNTQNIPLHGVYMAGEFVFQYTNAIRVQTIDEQLITYQNNYKVDRMLFSLNSKLGLQPVSREGKGFLFDWSIGYGITYFVSNNVDKRYTDNNNENFYDDFTGFFPFITGDLKFGWAFLQSKKKKQ